MTSIDPTTLATHYTRFRVAERLLLTGHSHQAWPDCGFEGQQRAWLDAAEFVDDKWERAFAKADRVRAGYARLLRDRPERIALGASTHDLLIRFLSGLPLRTRPRLVTTDGEYHTIRRQLDRLAEEGVEVVRVAAEPATELAARLAATVNDRTAAVLVSAVLFRSAHIVPGLADVARAARRVGAEILVDAYHAVNVIPFELPPLGLTDVYVVGGGYKYCQLGEGNCFLRIPEHCAMRPVVTGWFSEFAAIADADHAGAVRYGAGPARFAGSTYDPTSHYRAAEVFGFFERERLTPERLREASRHQIGLLARAFDALDLDPAVVARDRARPLEEVAGFLALAAPKAETLCAALKTRGVLTDVRGDVLRLGPAPYLTDGQLGDAIAALRDAARSG